MRRKAQLDLGSTPAIVMVVGLTFLVLATLAFIASKYGAAMPSDLTATITNETLTTVTAGGELVSNSTLCNFETFTVTQVVNATGGEIISSGNYTTTTDGYVKSTTSGKYNNTNWKVSYTAKYAGTGCDVNKDLETEISNNTGIAGIVLTISLVGIILSVLVGVFVIARNRGL